MKGFDAKTFNVCTSMREWIAQRESRERERERLKQGENQRCVW